MTPKKNLSIFFSNALRPEDRVTELMRFKFEKKVGRPWEDFKDLEALGAHETFRFSYRPPLLKWERGDGARPIVDPILGDIFPRETEVVFLTLPLTSDLYLRALPPQKALLALARSLARFLKEERADERYDKIVVGWGAYTKLTTRHGLLSSDPKSFHTFFKTGELFGERLLDPSRIVQTHGDGGTAAMILSAMKKAGLSSKDSLILSGAASHVGGAVARSALASDGGELSLGVKSLILLTGGLSSGPRYEKLIALKDRLLAQGDAAALRGRITLASSMEEAYALAPEARFFLCAGSAEGLTPKDFRPGTIIFDYSSPRGFKKGEGWPEANLLVLSAGYAEPIEKEFSLLDGSLDRSQGWVDIGAHGDYSLWGCFSETIGRGALGLRESSIGAEITAKELLEAQRILLLSSFGVSHPHSLDRRLSGWEEVRAFGFL